MIAIHSRMRGALTLVAAVALVAAASSVRADKPDDDECGDPVDDPCPEELANSANVYRLTSLDGTTLSGINKFGTGFTAELVPETRFKPAKLEHFPTDPVLPLAIAYNEAVQSGEGVLAALQAYVGAGGFAHVAIPPDPIHPPDPVAPIHVRALRPVALR